MSITREEEIVPTGQKLGFTSSYFTGILLVATEKDCNARWSCGKPGVNFRCGFCGHKFVVGDKWRFIYTNDIAYHGGNPLVCEQCNDSNETLRKRWVEKWDAWLAFVRAPENWHFCRDWDRP